MNCLNGVVSCAYGIRVIYSFLSSASETDTTLFLCLLCALQILMVRHLVVLTFFPQTDFHLIAVAWKHFLGLANSRGSWVECRGSWVKSRGSWVKSRGSWIKSRGSWVKSRGSWVKSRGSREKSRGS